MADQLWLWAIPGLPLLGSALCGLIYFLGLERRTAPESLSLNALGRVRVRLAQDVPVDDYRLLRRTGAFLLIDESDGSTLAAGMAETPDRNAGDGI